MNNQRIEEIEARWLRASSGPWTMESADSVSAPDIPEENYIRNFDDARRHGLVSTEKQWVEHLQQLVWEPIDEDDLHGRFSTIVAMPVRQLRSLEELDYRSAQEWIGSGWLQERIAKLMDGADPSDPTLPRRSGMDIPGVLFWIGKDARAEDVDFVVNASRDVGDLLAEVRRLQDCLRNAGR